MKQGTQNDVRRVNGNVDQMKASVIINNTGMKIMYV